MPIEACGCYPITFKPLTVLTKTMDLSQLWTLILNVMLNALLHPYSCSTDVIDIEYLIKRYVGLDETPFWKGSTGDIFACARCCIRRSICNSFNFNVSGVCELHTGVINDVSATKRDKSLMWANIWDWPVATLDPHCGSRPCNATEVCVPGHLTMSDPTTAGNCSYACIGMRIVCPLTAELSDGRKVGDVNVFRCPRGYVGGDSATCMPDGKWSKQIDYSCTPLIHHRCENLTLCAEIDGECIDKKCVCGQNKFYSTSKGKCQTALIHHPCENSAFCADINGECIGKKCVCGQNKFYSTSKGKCQTD